MAFTPVPPIQPAVYSSMSVKTFGVLTRHRSVISKTIAAITLMNFLVVQTVRLKVTATRVGGSPPVQITLTGDERREKHPALELVPPLTTPWEQPM